MDAVNQINREIADALAARDLECENAAAAYRREELVIGRDAAIKRQFERENRACDAFSVRYAELQQRREEILASAGR